MWDELIVIKADRTKKTALRYEMQFFALLMKIGVLGLAIWVVFYLVQFICLLKTKNHQWIHVFAWFFLLLSMVICVQTNPLLISFTGMSVLVFISIVAIYETSLLEA